MLADKRNRFVIIREQILFPEHQRPIVVIASLRAAIRLNVPSAAAIGSIQRQIAFREGFVQQRLNPGPFRIGDGLERHFSVDRQHAVAIGEEFAIGLELGGGIQSLLNKMLERADRNDGVVTAFRPVVAPVLLQHFDLGILAIADPGGLRWAERQPDRMATPA